VLIAGASEGCRCKFSAYIMSYHISTLDGQKKRIFIIYYVLVHTYRTFYGHWQRASLVWGTPLSRYTVISHIRSLAAADPLTRTGIACTNKLSNGCHSMMSTPQPTQTTCTASEHQNQRGLSSFLRENQNQKLNEPHTTLSKHRCGITHI